MKVFHDLPGSTKADTSWFSRMTPFQQQETLHQVKFKETHLKETEYGEYNKRRGYVYPHIMPSEKGYEAKVYYGDYTAIKTYFDEADIAFHTESLNLKSSQVCCINFLFPLKQDLRSATRVFKELFTNLVKVTKIEFEYTADDIYRSLGEPENGKRGQNRTSIDTAIFWNDTNDIKHISLIEWKYTEGNFGVCSSYNSGCKNLDLKNNVEQSCILSREKNRKYWSLMKNAGIDINNLSLKTGCPFQGPFYQLMRQQIFAYLLEKKYPGSEVELIAMSFAGNKALHKVPNNLKYISGKNDLIDVWNSVNTRKVRSVTVQTLLSAIDNTGDLTTKWRNYIKNRYGI